LKEKILKRQREMMKEHDLDALIAMSPENFGYVAGVIVPSQITVRSRHAICITPRRGDPVAVVVNIEEGLVRDSGWLEQTNVFSYNEFTQNPMEVAARQIEALGLHQGRIGIELNYLPTLDYWILANALPNVEWVNAEGLFNLMRQIKLGEEIAAIEDFGHEAEEIIYRAFEKVHGGMTEQDLANHLVNGFYAAGGDRLTMLVVASGPRSCFLNGAATNRQINSGDLVRVDLIGTKKGYYCDVCRTAVVGPPSSDQKETWAKMVEVHDRIIEQLRPGVGTKEIYDRFREDFLDAQLSPLDFVGHGLGLTLHEEPYIGRFSDVVLEENMVLCIEPIHVIPNQYGFQLENEVIITKNGCRIISNRYDYKTLPVIKTK